MAGAQLGGASEMSCAPDCSRKAPAGGSPWFGVCVRWQGPASVLRSTYMYREGALPGPQRPARPGVSCSPAGRCVRPGCLRCLERRRAS